MLVAATAWDGLAAELGTAAGGYRSVIAELTGAAWFGPSAAAMVSAVVPYVSWLAAAAGLAEESAGQARAAAGAFESAFAMTVPPPVIAANRLLLMTLVATNFFGQNGPAIAATEAQYLQMWAQDATAMYGYAAASAAASQLTPYQPPPSTTVPDAVSRAAAAAPQLLQQLSSPAAGTGAQGLIWNTIEDFLKYGLPTPANNWLGLTPPNYVTIFKQTLQAYFGMGVANFGWSIGQQLTFGSGSTVGSAGAWYPTPQFAGLHLEGLGGLGGVGAHTAGAVSASTGQAGKAGMLSVPANWTTQTSEATLARAAMDEDAMAPAGGTSGTGNALLRGIPAGAIGRRGTGYGHTNVYGARHSVVVRPPSAG